MVVEHSVVIRVTSVEDVQLTSGRPALYRLMMISRPYEVVANIWFLIPCIAGMPLSRINEKLGAETGDLAMTFKLEVVAVGLCGHDVRIRGGFCWKWSNGNELWKLVVMRNLFASCGSFSCLVSTTAVGEQFVDCEGGVFYVRMVEMFKKVTGAAHVHVCHHRLRAAKDNVDGNGFNTSVQLYAMAVHSNLSRHAAEEAFLRFAGYAVDAKFCTRRFVYINAWRETSPRTPSRTTTWQCATRPLRCHLIRSLSLIQLCRASSAVPFCLSLTLSPTPVQLCLLMQWQRRLPFTPWSASRQSGCEPTRSPKCLFGRVFVIFGVKFAGRLLIGM